MNIDNSCKIIIYMAKIDIFCVYLKYGKVFIHYDSQQADGSSRSKSDIMLRCELLHTFARKHKPEDALLIESIDKFDNYRVDNSMYPYINIGEYNLPDIATELTAKELLKIDVHVKRFMMSNGIENVRGGTFSEEILEDYLIQTLEKEFKTIRGDYSENISIVDNVETVIKMIENDVVITDKYKYVKNIYHFHKGLKNKYNELKYFTANNETYELNTNLLLDIQWIKQLITDTCSNSILNQDNLKGHSQQRYNNENYTRYENLKIHLKQLYEVNRKYYSEDEPSKNVVFLKNPEYIFDKFVYHYLNTDEQDYSNTMLDDYNRISLEICDEFENLYYRIMNRIQEYEFDISTYSKNFEVEGELLLYYFKNQT